MMVAASLGVLAGMFIGLGIAWLIAWKEDRRIRRVELDDSHRRLSTQINSVTLTRDWKPTRRIP